MVVERRRARIAFSVRVAGAVIGGQVPALAVAALAGGPAVVLPVLVVAGLLTASWFRAIHGFFLLSPRSRLHLYLGLWPFYAWWLACAVFAALVPLAFAVAALPGIDRQATLACAGGLALVTGVRGVWRRPRVIRLEVRFPDLPPAFDGYRIGQISDVHCGHYAPEARVRSWARRLAAEDPDLVAITGDLVAHGDDHVEAVARALGEASGRDGALACMGNHDHFGAGGQLVRALERQGIRVLDNHAVAIRRGDETLAVAGVDDTWTGRCDLPRALARVEEGAFTILLAHDPVSFPEAARRGVRLTLSGHTHGGQVGIPFLARRFNLARLVTPFTAGLYRQGDSFLYVNRGAGTTGPPFRLGVPAELTILTLRRGGAAGPPQG